MQNFKSRFNIFGGPSVAAMAAALAMMNLGGPRDPLGLAAARRARTRRDHLAKALWDRKARRAARLAALTPEDRERRRLIEGMTNWQRKQYARAGRPRDLDQVRAIAARPHWKRARVA